MKLKITLSIYVHSFEWRIAKDCMSLTIFLIVGDSVSTGYIGIEENSPIARSLSYENLLPLFVSRDNYQLLQ